ncbi:MAG: outer membrane protein assembly factor BamE [Pseudomonadota bacterium]
MAILRLLPVLLLAACVSRGDVASLVSPYRIDIQQGNYVSQEMVAQLKPGMTKDQVRFVLGTPLLTDVFHSDRWDYIYLFRPGNRGEPQKRQLTVFFEDGKLSRVAGDVVAAEPGELERAGVAPRSQVIDIGGDKKDEAVASKPEQAGDAAATAPEPSGGAK